MMIELDEEITSSLLTKYRAGGASPSFEGVLLAAALEAFGFADTGCTVSLERHGRDLAVPGLDVTRTVGWFTSVFPLRIDGLDGARGDRLARHVTALVRGVPNGGLGFGVLRRANAIEGVPSCDIAFNYLGDLSATKSALFELEPLPLEKISDLPVLADSPVILVAYLLHGKLRVSVQQRGASPDRHTAVIHERLRDCATEPAGEDQPEISSRLAESMVDASTDEFSELLRKLETE